MNNKPVYQFLGFKLISCKYIRDKDTSLEKISIKILENSFDENNHIFSLGLYISLEYQETEKSEFIFTSGNLINDLNWYNLLSNNQRDSLFVSIVFPFIREKINSITDDSRGNILLPIIDLKNIDLTKGITFTVNKL